jgi:hypothetical protein
MVRCLFSTGTVDPQSRAGGKRLPRAVDLEWKRKAQPMSKQTNAIKFGGYSDDIFHAQIGSTFAEEYLSDNPVIEIRVQHNSPYSPDDHVLTITPSFGADGWEFTIESDRNFGVEVKKRWHDE